MPKDSKVKFGHRDVSPAEKTELVGGVFSSVAARYDIMNDAMSLGSHRLFKRMLVELSGLRPGDAALDLAGGTGDITALLAPKVAPGGRVVLADLTANMMLVGRDRLLDQGQLDVDFCQAAAEQLPFADNSFACVTIGFGLRNFTDKDGALRDILRVLKPSGVLLVLEFSKPTNPILETGYRAFQSLWPAMGQALVGDSNSYKYLVESIREHPPQPVLKLMMADAGFQQTEYHNLLGGIAAIHRAVAP